MLELLRILLPTLAALFHERHDLVLENLLLRHQLQVALRTRPRPHIKTRDRFFWLVARRFYPAWRRHLVLVRPETSLLRQLTLDPGRVYQPLGQPRFVADVVRQVSTMS